jgi:hypothetical protein
MTQVTLNGTEESAIATPARFGGVVLAVVIVVHGTKTVLDINGGMQDGNTSSFPFSPNASDRGTAPNVGSAKSKGASFQLSASKHLTKDAIKWRSPIVRGLATVRAQIFVGIIFSWSAPKAA